MAFRSLKDVKLGGAGNEYYGIFEVNSMSAQNMQTKGMLPLELTDFMDDNGGSLPCEQGMLLVYDEAAGVVRKPKDLKEKVMIHNSEYKLYDKSDDLKDFALWAQKGSEINITQYKIDDYGRVILDANGLPQVDSGKSKAVRLYEDVTPFPRLYIAFEGDTYTTNTVIYDTADFGAGDDAFAAIVTAVEAGEVYAVVAIPDEATGIPKAWGGYHKLIKGATAPDAAKVFKAVKAYDLPDGQPAIRFAVV